MVRDFFLRDVFFPVDFFGDGLPADLTFLDLTVLVVAGLAGDFLLRALLI